MGAEWRDRWVMATTATVVMGWVETRMVVATMTAVVVVVVLGVKVSGAGSKLVA